MTLLPLTSTIGTFIRMNTAVCRPLSSRMMVTTAARAPAVARAYLCTPRYTGGQARKGLRSVSCFQQPYMSDAWGGTWGQGRMGARLMRELMREV